MRKKSIAFIGIDGAGKSTLINNLKKRLEENGEHVRVYYMGIGKDIKMPFLKSLIKIYSSLKYKKGTKKENKKTSLERERDNYRERNFLWLAIQYIEFLARYLDSRRYLKKTEWRL